MIGVKLMGGLGNQMFQYAAGRSLSIERGTELVLDLTFLLDRTPRKNFVFRDFDLTIFDIDVKTTRTIDERDGIFGTLTNFSKHYNKLLPIKLRKYYTEKGYSYNTSIRKLNSDVYLEGYWQSFLYFQDHACQLKKDFSFKYELNETETELNNKIRNSNSVCINVRRSDFLSNSYHGVCDEEYFKIGVQYLTERIPEIEIFVFSDDIKWCENNLSFGSPTTFVAHQYAGPKFSSYLQLMTNCKHFIIPNSTFGWWAAWLSNSTEKIVISPKRWFTSSKISTLDLIPSDWIRL